jgi:ABC-2 type transporter
MRWHILRALLHKEALRHLANRGGLVLFVLLIVAAMLLSFFGGKDGAAGLTPSVKVCYVDYYDEKIPFVVHLRNHVPPDLQEHIRFRRLDQAHTDSSGRILYEPTAGGIQLRPRGDSFIVWFWRPAGDTTGMAPFEIWFWRESFSFALAQGGKQAYAADAPQNAEDFQLAGGFEMKTAIATSLVMFGLFFVCVYLLPSLTCEERERGVLLAQALSPASTVELLAAKFLFYPVFGLALAAILAGTYRPTVLLSPFFWTALVVAVIGSMGIGLTIASIARTQRAASMGALCYMLVVALLLFICSQNNIPGLPLIAIEYHAPRMMEAALKGSVRGEHYLHLFGAATLAVGWTIAASVTFRRFGWQ